LLLILLMAVNSTVNDGRPGLAVMAGASAWVMTDR
jgi:hypothetical protein